MSGPSNYVRRAREQAAQRRLEIAKTLRDDPATTNLTFAKALNVSRHTIREDRLKIMEQLKNETKSETEQLRVEMVARLERLDEELEKHRKGGKLPVSVIHESHLLHRTLIELLGVRKPVTERLEVKKTTLRFETEVVSTTPGKRIQHVQTPSGWEQKEIDDPDWQTPKLITTEHTHNQLALRDGDDEA